MKIHWVTQEHSTVSNALGYNTHNKYMRKYCQKYFTFDDNADIALHIVPADHFRPIPGKVNILFTMWEFLDIPESYINGLNNADMIIVPSRFCKTLFEKYTTRPIHVCFEGVEAQNFPFFERKQYQGKFRFLWCGAPNPRKGYPLIAEVANLLQKFPNVELYIKTTVPKINWVETLVNIWKKRQYIFRKDGGRFHVRRMLARMPRPQLANKIKYYGEHKNIVFDTRMLPLNELVELYNSAHCFLLPTFGEGWGLTLCEAMATGAPCIATAVTGCADFFDENVGYPINYEIKKHELANYNLVADGYVPDTVHMVEQMLYVFNNYQEALKKGQRASERIHSKFTWERSAQRLNDIITKQFGMRKAA